MDEKPKEVRILCVEDEPAQAELALHQLRRAGMHCVALRVETEATLRAALADFAPDVILSDFSLPQFNGLEALRIATEVAPQIPFVFLSGVLGEERAIEALHRGAIDYVVKGNPARLAPAIQRALKESAGKAEATRQQVQIARLTRVLRMLSGINGLAPRITDRTELLSEACRIAVKVGGYASAIVLLKQGAAGVVRPIAWTGIDAAPTHALRATLEESAARDTSIVGRILKSGRVFVSNDTVDLEATAQFNRAVLAAGFRCLVGLPLLIDGTPMGVLVLTAREAGTVSEEELAMLRELASNLSFALQYHHKDSTVRLLSHFDPKTGLAKRPLFCDRVGRLLTESKQARTRLGVVVFDIGRLSIINDSFGRQAGDLLLQHVTARLRQHFPNTEHLAHFNGGTFALMQGGVTSGGEDSLSTLEKRALTLFEAPFRIEGREIPVTIRCGLVVYPDHGEAADTLVQHAEAALRAARTSNEQHSRYDAGKHDEAVARLALEYKLRLALERDQFELHYQPKVNVRTRSIEGVEALLRWRDPEAGLISPAAFLPLLESTGLIVEVGDWVLRRAAHDCQLWANAGMAVRVAVNISPVQLGRDDFVENFLQRVRPWMSDRHGLDVEIIEGQLGADAETEIRRLKMLRAAGIKVAIDDFGTGYSSLSRLSTLPIDALKIDRTFIKGLPEDAGSRAVVVTILSLARAFKMSVIAEGVETAEQLGVLWDLGCDQSQGFFHSKPVPRDELTGLLQHGNGDALLPAGHVVSAGGLPQAVPRRS